MRKYLWALALCGAAGMAVPSWAQERSKSLFGLGRSKPAATPTKEAAKSSKLRNYGELFGEKQSPAESPNAEAPSPESVRKMMDESQDDSVSAVPSESLDPADKGTPTAAANTKTMTVRKAPVVAKTSLLDDSEELDRLEALDEIEEAQEYTDAVSKTPTRQDDHSSGATGRSGSPRCRPSAGQGRPPRPNRLERQACLGNRSGSRGGSRCRLRANSAEETSPTSQARS
jgi:hypothetical protein